jgi:hypothetical protein
MEKQRFRKKMGFRKSERQAWGGHVCLSSREGTPPFGWKTLVVQLVIVSNG